MTVQALTDLRAPSGDRERGSSASRSPAARCRDHAAHGAPSAGPRGRVAAVAMFCAAIAGLIVGCSSSPGPEDAAPTTGPASTVRSPSADDPSSPPPTSTMTSTTVVVSTTVVSAPSSSPSTAPSTALNRAHDGAVLGPACADPAELVAAVAEAYGPGLAANGDLRSIACVDGWATAWTNPDPTDPDLPDPEVVVFRLQDGRWRAVGTGTSGNCIAAGVPDAAQVELDCF